MNDEESKLRERITKLKRLAHNNSNFNEMTSALNKVNELDLKLKDLLWQASAEIINGVMAIADRHYAIANALMEVVNKCRMKQTTQGIDQMVAYAFNSQGIEPRYSGGGGLPVGRHPVTITKTEAKPTKDNTGGFIEFTLTAFDGPNKGGVTSDRLNLHNTNPQAVEIANKQLAAYCAVTGVFHFQDTNELIGKPFVVEIAQQKGNANYTEVVAIFDMNGNEPGKQGQGAMTGQPANTGGPPAGFGAAGNIPPADGGQGGQPANTGGWGGQPADPNAGQQQGGQPAGGGAWGNQGGQPANTGQPANAGTGWQQGGQPAGGQPGWGQR